MSNSKEFFTDIKKIEYNPNATKHESLVFRHYNRDEIVMGKKMSEWLRFAVCFWHTYCWDGNDPFGSATLPRPWKTLSDTPIERAKDTVRAAFEFMTKLGVEYYTFHDRDVAPEGANLQETNANLDVIVDLLEEMQNKTSIKPLWGTANLFSNRRYANGAITNPDVDIFAYAGAQVKKMLEVTKRLGGENFVFWGGREGYQSLINTDVKKETDHLAKFFRMAVNYKEKIGFKGQFLLEPKPKEPTKHQYDYDAQTVIGFLKANNLQDHFKLNIEPNHTTLAGHCYEHDLVIASQYNMLGSLDINTGDQSVGWDTDQFLTDPKLATLVLHAIIKQNGLAPGGLNFDCKVRRESTDLEDLFISHIAAMDVLAYGLKKAAEIIQDGILQDMLDHRYITFKNTKLGQKAELELATLEDLEEHVLANGEPESASAKQEKFEQVFNSYFI
jgi:xylose isomerase